ncbi:MAG: HAD family hydrolase [Candidatus Limivicinus sp.]|nr:HAD family hydrolase [Candidatus Limivicinus sp.]
MRIKTVMFDLDGTLLPMDQDQFTKYYFGLLAKKLAPYGYNAEQLVSGIWAGTAAMVKNNGSCTNEEAFWKKFCALMGEKVLEDKPLFEEFYRVEFQGARASCGFAPQAAGLVKKLKAAGCRVLLATNPIFPAIATENRIRWTGLEPEDFELYTTYENACRCKPNPDYYRDILSSMKLDPSECLMVGNDATEDTAAGLAGMQVFLLTDCLINKENKDLSQWPHGGFEELEKFIFG